MMKAVLLLILILIIEKSLAQRLEFEFLIQPSITSLRGMDTLKNNFEPTTNFSSGFGINYFLNNNSSINLSILYDNKGGKADYYFVIKDDQNQIIDEGWVNGQMKFDYITIPFQWSQRFGHKIKYQFGIGLYIGYLLKQEQVITGLNGSINITEDLTTTFRNFDFGFSSSFNMYIPVKDALSFRVGLNDNLGMINTSTVNMAGDAAIKHNSIGLIFGLNFKPN